MQKSKIIEAVQLLLEGIGEDPTREGLLKTPERVAKAYMETWANGYGTDIKGVLTSFENPGIDQLIMVPKIDFYSLCEHHLAPFYGQIHIGYVPNGRVLGVSKFARIVDVFAHRLQIQERLVQDIASAIEDAIHPQGIAVVGKGIHLCMRSRGVQKQNAEMVTSVMLGKFRREPELREEFLSLL